jgi:hypothetical protein
MTEDLFGGGASAILSDDGVYRYTLGRRWAPGPAVLWIMLNPSTADAAVDDPTIRRCIGFSKAWGYSALTVVNLFALRATNPARLYRHEDPVGPVNDAHIVTQAQRAVEAVAAWGTHGALRDRAEYVRRLVDGIPLVCLGVTRGGHPRHPLYVRGSTGRVPFLPGIPNVVGPEEGVRRDGSERYEL